MTIHPHQARWDREDLEYRVERLVEALDRHGLTSRQDRVSYRRRLLQEGITREQAEGFLDGIAKLKQTEESCVATLLEMGATLDCVMEYVSAPRTTLEAGAQVDTRETVFNRISQQLPQGLSGAGEGWKTRAGYGTAFLAAASSLGMLAGQVMAFLPNPAIQEAVAPINEFFNQLGDLAPELLDAGGVPLASLLPPGPSTQALLLGLGMAGALFHRKAALGKRANLSQHLFDPAHGLAEEMFGASQAQRIQRQYARLSEGDKHLLAHLSPHALRVVLIGGEDAGRAILASQPPPFANQVLALAHGSAGRLDFIGNMMALSLPESFKAPMRAILEGKGRPSREAGGVEDLMGRLHGRRQGPVKAEPTPLANPRTGAALAGR